MRDVGKICETLAEAGLTSLAREVSGFVRPVRSSHGRLEFSTRDDAARDLGFRIAQALRAVTGEKWVVTLSDRGGGLSLDEARAAETDARQRRALATPLAAAIMAAFPNGVVISLEDPDPAPHERWTIG